MIKRDEFKIRLVQDDSTSIPNELKYNYNIPIQLSGTSSLVDSALTATGSFSVDSSGITFIIVDFTSSI